MAHFKRILVGVDLTRCKDYSFNSLSSIAREAIDWGIEFARTNSATLVFFSALNLTEDHLHFLESEDRTRLQDSVGASANALLQELVREAAGCGVKARAKCASGRGWLEIIHEVLREHHDLVVVGTRDLTGFRRMLFGNTAMKLFRSCPCPVLVTKVGSNVRPLNIAVATDLHATSLAALRQGVALGNMIDSHVHVLHVLDFPLDRIWRPAIPDTTTLEYHRRVRAQANIVLQEQLHQVAAHTLGDRLHVHLVDGIGLADATIQSFLQTHAVHLLVMGTIGRSGFSGMMFGNTAERLLPEVQCSVLAIKPPDFCCPVQS